jgi:hypothetical protein
MYFLWLLVPAQTYKSGVPQMPSGVHSSNSDCPRVPVAAIGTPVIFSQYSFCDDHSRLCNDNFQAPPCLA